MGQSGNAKYQEFIMNELLGRLKFSCPSLALNDNFELRKKDIKEQKATTFLVNPAMGHL